MSSDKDWLDALKPGDEAVIPARLGGVANPLRLERRTATQLVFKTQHGREIRARVKDGRLIGRTGYYASWVEPMTDAARDGLEYAALAGWLSGLTTAYGALRKDRAPLAVLRAMKATYDEHMAKQEPAA